MLTILLISFKNRKIKIKILVSGIKRLGKRKRLKTNRRGEKRINGQDNSINKIGGRIRDGIGKMGEIW